ncbi:hypothetical protein M3Y99_01122400 [Aphelenchoides fujianensis]|nr:hypothetical protein M3Y99_01122400 [Aphelenchoides fujianensis]
MQAADLLGQLHSVEHFPTDFDPRFFDGVAAQLFSTDPSLDVRQFVEELERPGWSNSKIIACVLLATLKRAAEADGTASIFAQKHAEWMERAADCPCMQTLLFELATCLAKRRALSDGVLREVGTAAIGGILAEHTNIDLRRDLCAFVTIVMDEHPEMDETIARPLLAGSYRTDHPMIIDGIAFAVANSAFLHRLDDAERLAVHERLKGMKRPSLHFLQLAAKIYANSPDTMAQRLSEEFVNAKVPALVAAEIFKLENALILKESLLKLISAHLSENVDHLVDCLEEFEETFPEEVERVRREITNALPNPRHCSGDSFVKFLNHLRLNEGIASVECVRALLSAKPRLQRNPELLDTLVVDAEDLTALLQDPQMHAMFHELTVDVLMAKHQFNWIHLDSAIGILNMIADFFNYDETATHDRIAELMGEKQEDEAGFVQLTAAKFLLRHAPHYVLETVGELFLGNSDADLRVAVLNRLILSTPNERPPAAKLHAILDEVIQLETNFDVQSAALNFAQKLALSSADHRQQADELEKIVREHEAKRNRSRAPNLDELLEMVQAVKMSGGCEEECVSKECY